MDGLERIVSPEMQGETESSVPTEGGDRRSARGTPPLSREVEESHGVGTGCDRELRDRIGLRIEMLA